MIDSRDDQGHYCGQSEATGQFVDLGSSVVGFCGPNCEHCQGFRVYCIQDGVWVCAADYEPTEQGR